MERATRRAAIIIDIRNNVGGGRADEIIDWIGGEPPVSCTIAAGAFRRAIFLTAEGDDR